MKRSVLWVILSVMLAPLWVSGAGFIVVDEAYWFPPGPRPPELIPPPRPPHPWPPAYRPRPFAPLEMTRYQADVKIADQIASTSVEQEFLNPNERRMEGTFLLPVPRGAQLRRFTLEINGKATEAELLPADKARGIYEDIVRKLKDPALLEYEGQDLYKVRIFPIEPRERKRVTYSYTQVLTADAGLVSYTHPLGAGKYSARAPGQVSLRVSLETKRPLKSIYSPSHAVEVRRDGPHRATAGFEARDPATLTDFQLYYAAEGAEVGASLLAHRSPGEAGHFLLLLSPGLDDRGGAVLPKDIVFVLDTSGSMAGPKLDQARKALLFCVDNLNDGDRFEILRFATDIEPVFDRLTEVNPESRARARTFIQGLKPIGGTAIDDALRRALALPSASDRQSSVVFLTDGLPTVGETREETILQHVRDATAGRRVFCFGIGHDVNTHLLDKITESTRGASTYVLPEEDLELKVSSFFSRIKDPVLVNPVLRVTGDVRLTQLHPFPLPDLFRGDQLVVAGRYTGDGDVSLVLEGKTGGKPAVIEHAVRFPATAEENDFVPRLWATRRVGYLLDELRLHGENTELRDEVVDLARRYGIVTPNTAYLIVEDERRRGLAPTAQSLPRVQQDQAARDRMEVANIKMMRERYGVAAVSRARSEQALQQATAPAAGVAAGASEAGRALTGAAGARAEAAGLGTDAPQYVQGRTFFWNENQWVDSQIQKLVKPRTATLKLGGSEYLELLRKHPQAAAWLALGPRVQFVLGTTVYSVEP